MNVLALQWRPAPRAAERYQRVSSVCGACSAFRLCQLRLSWAVRHLGVLRQERSVADAMAAPLRRVARIYPLLQL